MKTTLWLIQGLIAVVGAILVWILIQDAPMSHPPPAIFIPVVIFLLDVINLPGYLGAMKSGFRHGSY